MNHSNLNIMNETIGFNSNYMTKYDIYLYLLDIHKKNYETKLLNENSNTTSDIEYLFNSSGFNNLLSNIKYQVVQELELFDGGKSINNFDNGLILLELNPELIEANKTINSIKNIFIRRKLTTQTTTQSTILDISHLMTKFINNLYNTKPELFIFKDNYFIIKINTSINIIICYQSSVSKTDDLLNLSNIIDYLCMNDSFSYLKNYRIDFTNINLDQIDLNIIINQIRSKINTKPDLKTNPTEFNLLSFDKLAKSNKLSCVYYFINTEHIEKKLSSSELVENLDEFKRISKNWISQYIYLLKDGLEHTSVQINQIGIIDINKIKPKYIRKKNNSSRFLLNFQIISEIDLYMRCFDLWLKSLLVFIKSGYLSKTDSVTYKVSNLNIILNQTIKEMFIHMTKTILITYSGSNDVSNIDKYVELFFNISGIDDSTFNIIADHLMFLINPKLFMTDIKTYFPSILYKKLKLNLNFPLDLESNGRLFCQELIKIHINLYTHVLNYIYSQTYQNLFDTLFNNLLSNNLLSNNLLSNNLLSKDELTIIIKKLYLPIFINDDKLMGLIFYLYLDIKLYDLSSYINTDTFIIDEINKILDDMILVEYTTLDLKTHILDNHKQYVSHIYIIYENVFNGSILKMIDNNEKIIQFYGEKINQLTNKFNKWFNLI